MHTRSEPRTAIAVTSGHFRSQEGPIELSYINTRGKSWFNYVKQQGQANL